MIAWGPGIYTTFQSTSMWLAKLGHDPPFLGVCAFGKAHAELESRSPFYFNGENKANCFWHLMVGLACIRHVMNYSNTKHFFNGWWITLKRHRKRTKRKVLFLDFPPALTKNWLLSQNEVTIQISLRKNMPNIVMGKMAQWSKSGGVTGTQRQVFKKKTSMKIVPKGASPIRGRDNHQARRESWAIEREKLLVYCRLPIGSMNGI